jgi:RNA polymerase sigma factor (sigma-70 family)
VRLTETDRVYEELLLVLVRSGDRDAAERLAARWQPRLIRTARRLLQDEEQAREAVQEAWAGIARGWGRMADPARFPAWAFSILHRRCADRIRAERRRRARSGEADERAEPAIAPRGEDAAAISQALALLPPDQRAAAILFFGEGLTLTEIAEATGVPLGTAKSRLFNARRALKSALEGDLP